MNPRNVGRVEEADAIAEVTGPCGDTMEISLRRVDFKVVDTKLWTNGCNASIACGSVTTGLIKGTRI